MTDIRPKRSQTSPQIKKRSSKKIAIIYDTDAFGTAGKDMLISEYKKKGITPTTVEGITAGTKDFTPTLESIRKSGAEAINTMMTASADVAQLVIQMRQLGINTDLVAHHRQPKRQP